MDLKDSVNKGTALYYVKNRDISEIFQSEHANMMNFKK